MQFLSERKQRVPIQNEWNFVSLQSFNDPRTGGRLGFATELCA